MTRAIRSATVVVPVLNGADTVGDMLSALIAQSGKSATEIIVVDNGSTDATREIIARYPSVRRVRETRRGPAAARNAGLRAARGEIILHCDADTLPSRNWVTELVSLFRDPSVTLAAGRTLSFPPTSPAEQYLASAQLYDAELNVNRPVLPFVASMNMAVRRDAALAIGGWNDEMMTSEDVDFSTRLLTKFPGSIAYAPNAVVFHRNRSTDAALKKQAWTYGEGVADTYRRYPHLIPWGVSQYTHLLPNLAARTFLPLWLRLRGIGNPSEVEVRNARYHRMWTWWFWSGFFSFRRHGTYKSMRETGSAS